VLVLALGASVQAFALDRQQDEFVLTHADMRIPAATDRIAIDASQTRFWTPPIRRYVDECLAGAPGPRGKDFQVQWLGSMVAEAHRILTRGGVLVCQMAGRPRQPWLLQEINPISFVIERAGGRASTGITRILDIGPTGPQSRPSLIFGSSEEVERLEAYHGGQEAGSYDAPLFAPRGLFRSSV
jgi:fructose-1,6-bisphosphatase I/sedoheptulose-1,7-bisphosphatase